MVVLEIKGDVVKIGVKAPRDVSVYRQEVFVEIQAENTRAAGADRAVAQVSNAGALLKQALGNKPSFGTPGAGFARPAPAKVQPEDAKSKSSKAGGDPEGDSGRGA